ncbi:3-methyl-2-oxobutanoate hydroxymethyltransferase [Halostella sp. PRR32]|uniref:3-methyl-2-oxobutanoate hydroxymethyltransferase n=1 Tax=Halostella sp. PRR32 TaxID=3098147 RepID=UPI0034E09E67
MAFSDYYLSRVSIRDVREKYESGQPLTMLTAYDAPIARQVDAGGVDMILVGDSAGHNHLWYEVENREFPAMENVYDPVGESE